MLDSFAAATAEQFLLSVTGLFVEKVLEWRRTGSDLKVKFRGLVFDSFVVDD